MLQPINASTATAPNPAATEPQGPATDVEAQAAAAPQPAPPALPLAGQVIGRSERVLIYVPRVGDTYATVAARFLTSAAQAWQVQQANALHPQPVPGYPVVVPLVPRNPLGVTADGVQSVPILCYHRLASGTSRMAVSPARFEAQMNWLAAHGYHVVSLSDLAAFMAGQKALPPRSVVITFDDGYESVYRHAFGVLKQLGMPATLFLYTDFIGAPDALNWVQIEEMRASGLVDVQAHSKSHRRLTERLAGESDAAYRHNLDLELQQPRAVIEKRLAESGQKVRHFAYPYGDADEAVLAALRRHGYELGLTVVPGGNPFYAAPLLLRRIMIYGDHSIDDFKARLHGSRSAG